MATIHEISSEWQIEGLSPTWVKVHKSVVEYDLAQSRIRALEAERDALAADAARLDYLEKNARCDPKMDGNHVWWPTSFNQAQNLKGQTLRLAIDAAMKGE